MKLVLIRHTRLAVPPGICYGQSEMPLADTFEAEAANVQEALPWTPELIWSSPAQRCRALAKVLQKNGAVMTGANVCLHCDPRLSELNFGAWEGQHWEALKGPEMDRWIHDPWHARPPGGETADELLERVQRIRTELLKGGKMRRVVVVTHAGVIRAWRSLAEGIPLATVFAEPVPHGIIWPGK